MLVWKAVIKGSGNCMSSNRGSHDTGPLHLDLGRGNGVNLWAAASAFAAQAALVAMASERCAARLTADSALSANAHAVAILAWPVRLKPTGQAHLHVRSATTPSTAVGRAPIVADVPFLARGGDVPACRGQHVDSTAQRSHSARPFQSVN